jgi:hypothetical protein
MLMERFWYRSALLVARWDSRAPPNAMKRSSAPMHRPVRAPLLGWPICMAGMATTAFSPVFATARLGSPAQAGLAHLAGRRLEGAKEAKEAKGAGQAISR